MAKEKDPIEQIAAKRNKGGRPAMQWDERTAKQVETLTGYGLTVPEVGHLIGMSHPTVMRLYMPELERGRIVADAAVVQSLFKMATHPTKPNVAAAIFWAKCRLRWREDGEEAPGKKEAAELLGKVAEKGTKWEGLLS